MASAFASSAAAGLEDMTEAIRSELFADTCRYYEKELPDSEELVMVHVRRIAEMGAYVELLEYENREGMVLLSELSRRRIRSIHRLIKPGENAVVMVIRVDKEQGYIDLSKRRVTPDDAAKHEAFYLKSKKVDTLLRYVRRSLPDVPLRTLYEKIAWPLHQKYPHALDGLNAAARDPTVLDDLKLDEKLRLEVLAQVQRRTTVQPLKIRADVEVTCFCYDGVDALRAALQAGIDSAPAAMPISIQIIAPPLYVMTTMAAEKAEGLEAMTRAIDVIQTRIKSFGGNLNVKTAPHVSSKEAEEYVKREVVDEEGEDGAADGGGAAAASEPAKDEGLVAGD